MRDPFQPLRNDVSYLGHLLGETLVEQEGQDLLAIEEKIRGLAKERREHLDDHAATEALASAVNALDTPLAERVARAFTHYFQLVNLAEQHHRTRRRRDYAREGTQQPGSLDVVFRDLARHVPRDRFIEVLARTTAKLVFTAHPSEAQRRTVLEKHRRLVTLLERRDHTDLTPQERSAIDREAREEIASLWQTDEIRNEKPRVGDEVKNVLFYLEEILFPLIPGFYAALEDACEHAYGERIAVPTVLRFGSWVGADMDGNPNVTPDVAIDTSLAQASRVLDLYAREVTSLGAALSQSTRRVRVSKELTDSLEADATLMPELARTLVATTHHEPYRRKLRFVGERLRATRAALVLVREEYAAARELVLPSHAYANVASFIADLDVLYASLRANKGDRAGARVQALLRQAHTFGFHLAELDVRIPAEWVRRDARLLLGLPEDAPLRFDDLTRALAGDYASFRNVERGGAGIDAVRAVLRIKSLTFGGGADSLILSMTHGAEDMLAALLLARVVDPKASITNFAIVPLFETLDDLERSGDELRRALSCSHYASYVKARGVQELMLGYSDSNKDAGIVGSSFALYRAQQRLVAIAHEHDVKLEIFHGRGGSIGRGGGSAQRAIESLPTGAIDGRFKLTEQGEVLGWKYLVPEIALRNLELTIAGVIAHTLSPKIQADRDPSAKHPEEHEAIFERVAAISTEHYRALIHDEAFPDYFAATTPIEDIPRLNIESRPAQRSGDTNRPKPKLDDLRAIPWVFAWTQSRQMVPGWYGAGIALTWLLREHGVETAKRMVREWPFFATTLDAIAVSLAQADMHVAAQYAALIQDPKSRRLFFRIALGHARAVRAIRKIFDREGVLRAALAPETTLARSIELRNPYVDPLSFIQIELIRRKRADTAAKTPPELERAILLTINGIAAGLRSTG